MPSSNAVVLLAAPLDDRALAAARDALGQISGVARVEAGRKLRCLLLVGYDPRVISTRALLAALAHLGLPARLVGA